MSRAFLWAFLSFLMLVVLTPGCPGESGASDDMALPAIERKLLGEWKGGACRGNWVFRDNGTFELDHYSPAILQLSGTWKMRWDALPPTLVTTFSSSVDSSYAGKKWELKLTQLDEQTMEFKTPGGGLSRCERSKK